MTVALVTGPCEPGIKRQLLRLYSHMFKTEAPWWQVGQALDGQTGELQVRFWVGLIGDDPISVVMSAEHRHVGVFGNVVTAPEHRQKGACKGIMSVQMEDCRARGVQALYLGTGYDGVAYRIYHAFGFRSIQECSGIMRWTARTDFDEVWWRRGQVTVRAVAWKDWPTMRVLIAAEAQQRLRNFTYKVSGRESPSMNLVTTIRDCLDGRAQAMVAECATGAVVGFASLKPLGPGSAHLDAFVHPQFQDALPSLLSSLRYPPMPVTAYVERGLIWQAQALRQQGFHETGSVALDHGIEATVMTR